ncbi:MAG: leucine--tRNA ligase [Spirochaetales bacterium]|nr:leucine--tRNA ligase [Spirochaetales bacterium]
MNTPSNYEPEYVEGKWQKEWEEKKRFHVKYDKTKKKYYVLIEFPYPSGDGLHVGHLRPYTAMDIITRKRRKEGYNVLFPVGWDAFGLPTENYAIKTQIHPRDVTKRNIARFKAQLKKLGYSFDWSREINTTSPAYYKWTQWIFLKLFEKGLAYKDETYINWCTDCKVGLANEEVVNGVCERCSGKVIRRMKKQWILKITEYAERLIQDLEIVDFIERAKIQQINWIGKSTGMNVVFKTVPHNKEIRVFTTRPDTLFGATYMVLAPEHPVIKELSNEIENKEEIDAYIKKSMEKSDFERVELIKEKTGLEIKGISAINPVNGEKIPVWISDYVLITYGTGAIMAVPGHDTRDWEFAKKFNLPIVEVVKGGDIEKEAYVDIDDGIMVNSGFLNGLKAADAIERISDDLEKQHLGKREVNYKLRDWIFSRQRYWGEPIPLVNCEKCGWVPVPEEDLPVLLPDIENFKPGIDSESPLISISEWVNITCPKCGNRAKRETDTMPQWAGSSWYFLRYTDPDNNQCLADNEKLKYWLPVDWYNGGMEHTTLHLLYSRFWHKFLYDVKVVPVPEPYQKRTSHGMILGENNEKMSKSKGNVINPDDIVNEFGADAVRLYEMFIGDFEKEVPWSQNGLKGCRKYLDRVWSLINLCTGDTEIDADMELLLNKTIKKVSEDIERLKFNTAIASLMTLVNTFHKRNKVTRNEMSIFLQLLNPFAPHITEELWEILDFKGCIEDQSWPRWDENKILEKEVTIAIQVNGKLRGTVLVPHDASQEEAAQLVKQNKNVEKYINDKKIVKEIYIPGKIFNFVVR